MFCAILQLTVYTAVPVAAVAPIASPVTNFESAGCKRNETINTSIHVITKSHYDSIGKKESMYDVEECTIKINERYIQNHNRFYLAENFPFIYNELICENFIQKINISLGIGFHVTMKVLP